MGYRKRSDESREWNRWLQAHLSDMLSAGLPAYLWEDKFRWLRFVDHGYDHETGWKPEMLTQQQRQKLSEFVEQEYGRDKSVIFYRLAAREV